VSELPRFFSKAVLFEPAGFRLFMGFLFRIALNYIVQRKKVEEISIHQKQNLASASSDSNDYHRPQILWEHAYLAFFQPISVRVDFRLIGEHRTDKFMPNGASRNRHDIPCVSALE
jgi:hypothetical protein